MLRAPRLNVSGSQTSRKLLLVVLDYPRGERDRTHYPVYLLLTFRP